MNDDQFQSYIDSCFDELEEKQKYLVDTFGFGSFDKYEYDFDKEEIYFVRGGKVVVVAKIVPIGSFNSDDNTWMWAWANEAFPDHLKDKSSQLKQLEDITGFDMFNIDVVDIDADMTWEIAGMALNLLGFQGVYRGPANNTQYFYAMDDIYHVSS